jgi:hypothetical protein
MRTLHLLDTVYDMSVSKKSAVGTKTRAASSRRTGRGKVSASKRKKNASPVDRRAKAQTASKKQWAPVRPDEEGASESDAQSVEEAVDAHLPELTQQLELARTSLSETEESDKNQRLARRSTTGETPMQGEAAGTRALAVSSVDAPQPNAPSAPHVPVPQKEVW